MDEHKKTNNIDLELLKENLSLSVEERLKKHADALYLLETLESYKYILSDEEQSISFYQNSISSLA